MRKRMMSLLLAISVLSQCFTGVSFAKAKTKIRLRHGLPMESTSRLRAEGMDLLRKM